MGHWILWNKQLWIWYQWPYRTGNYWQRITDRQQHVHCRNKLHNRFARSCHSASIWRRPRHKLWIWYVWEH